MAIAFHDNITKIIGAGTTGCAIIGGMWTAFTHINEIKTKFESSQDRIAQLENTVKDLRGQIAEAPRNTGGVRGEQGPKGEKGERGIRGDNGPEGPMGPIGAIGPIGPKGDNGISKLDVQKMIDQAIVQKSLPAKVASADGLSPSSFVSSNQAATPAAGCMTKAAFAASSSLMVKTGLEICDTDGEILWSATKIDSKHIYIFIPGKGDDSCSIGSTCTENWLKDKVYFIEKISEDDRGKYTAKIRIKSNS